MGSSICPFFHLSIHPSNRYLLSAVEDTAVNAQAPAFTELVVYTERMEPCRANGDERRPSRAEGSGEWWVAGRPAVPVRGAFQRR